MQKKQLYVFLPLIFLLILMDVPPFLIFFFASAFVPFNAYAYDERADVNVLLNSLPYTRKKIIAARYLGALGYMAVATVSVSCVMFVLGTSFSLQQVAIGVGGFLLFGALAFPLFYLFQQGNITAVIMIGAIIATAVGPLILNLVAPHASGIISFFTRFSMNEINAMAAVVLIVMYVISWAFTTMIYERKVF